MSEGSAPKLVVIIGGVAQVELSLEAALTTIPVDEKDLVLSNGRVIARVVSYYGERAWIVDLSGVRLLNAVSRWKAIVR